MQNRLIDLNQNDCRERHGLKFSVPQLHTIFCFHKSDFSLSITLDLGGTMEIIREKMSKSDPAPIQFRTEIQLSWLMKPA